MSILLDMATDGNPQGARMSVKTLTSLNTNFVIHVALDAQGSSRNS